MTTIKNPLFKKIIHDTITMTEDFDITGKMVPRTSFKSDLISVHDVRSIVKKIEGDFVCTVEKDGVLTSMKNKEYTEDHGKRVNQSYGHDEIEFSDSEMKGIKNLYKEKKEFPSLLLTFPDEIFEEFNALIK